MASYKELDPLKDGTPRIKITVEEGYDETTGRRIRHTKTVRMKSMSDRAIRKAITDFEIEVANADKKVNLEKITFGDFVKRWMKMYVKTDLTIKTRDTYKSALEGGILDYFRGMKLSKIKTFHIVEFFAEQKRNKKRSLVIKFGCLKSIFSKAVFWEVIENNPMDGVDKPVANKKKNEVDFYGEEELKKLFKVLENVNPKYKMQIKLAALVGLRASEIAGIRIENINYNDETILIDKTLQYDKETKRFFLGQTKTKKERIVDVPSLFMDELKRYVTEHNKLRLKSGSAWNPLLDDDGKPINLLFTKEDGRPAHLSYMGMSWRKIMRDHNLPQMPFHGFRHTCASYMVSRGKNFKFIQEQLGHTDIKMTLNRYSHLSRENKREAINVFNDIL